MTPQLRLLDRGVARHALQLGRERGERRLSEVGELRVSSALFMQTQCNILGHSLMTMRDVKENKVELLVLARQWTRLIRLSRVFWRH